MTFWSFMGHRALAIVLAIITFILGFAALMSPLGGSGTVTIILWILTIGFGIASAYFFKTQH
ncbi:hypothetical protein JXB02_01670 [Candidatus Woesearchaeota archaeon]|nr:hypothetical protein [Candidatus Woesearchaeota archaeon]